VAIDAADLGPAGTAVEGSFELVEPGGGAGGEGFDATVVEIADPAAEAEAHGFPLGEGAVADTLDAAADEVAAAEGHEFTLCREGLWTRGSGSGFP
jgi:hypothetical protein